LAVKVKQVKACLVRRRVLVSSHKIKISLVPHQHPSLEVNFKIKQLEQLQMDFLISLKVVLDSSKIKVSWLHLVLVDYRSNLVSQLRQVSETHLPLKVLGVLADFQLQINNSSNLILVLLN